MLCPQPDLHAVDRLAPGRLSGRRLVIWLDTRGFDGRLGSRRACIALLCRVDLFIALGNNLDLDRVADGPDRRRESHPDGVLAGRKLQSLWPGLPRRACILESREFPPLVHNDCNVVVLATGRKRPWPHTYLQHSERPPIPPPVHFQFTAVGLRGDKQIPLALIADVGPEADSRALFPLRLLCPQPDLHTVDRLAPGRLASRRLVIWLGTRGFLAALRGEDHLFLVIEPPLGRIVVDPPERSPDDPFICFPRPPQKHNHVPPDRVI